MANTGRKIYTRLLKVSDDGLNTPLDIDNVPTSISGKPQAVKLNTLGEEGYITPSEDLVLCPLPILRKTVYLTVNARTVSGTDYFHFTLSEPLQQDITNFSVGVNGGGSVLAPISANTTGTNFISTTNGVVSIDGNFNTSPINEDLRTLDGKIPDFEILFSPNPTNILGPTTITVTISQTAQGFFNYIVAETTTIFLDPITIEVEMVKLTGTENYTLIIPANQNYSQTVELQTYGDPDTIDSIVFPNYGAISNFDKSLININYNYIYP